MIKRITKQTNTSELLQIYQTAATQRGKAIDAGDSRAANKAFDKLTAVYRELRARSEEARLLPLLQSGDRHVRLWAATHALKFAPEKGEPVLLELETGSGLSRLEAEYTLLEWRKGNLKFP